MTATSTKPRITRTRSSSSRAVRGPPMKRVELVDLAAGVREHRALLLAAVERVAASGRFVLGDEVLAFEQALAEVCRARFAVSVASGTDALVLALVASGVATGDAVVTTPLSFVATAEAILRVGAVPLFVDVDPESACLCPRELERFFATCDMGPSGPTKVHRGRRVSAVVPVHLYGRIADLVALEEIAVASGACLVADAAQAVAGVLGARSLTSFGAAALSFLPTKNLGAWGDGGAVLTDDEGVAQRIRSLRTHGLDAGVAEELGYNSRLDALQAAVLAAKLPTLRHVEERRRAHAAYYRAELPAWVRRPPALAIGDVCHLFTVRGSRRDELAAHLDACGIATGVYYRQLLFEHPAIHSRLDGAPSSCPVAAAFAREALSLPIHEHLAPTDLERVVAAVRAFGQMNGLT